MFLKPYRINFMLLNANLDWLFTRCEFLHAALLLAISNCLDYGVEAQTRLSV